MINKQSDVILGFDVREPPEIATGRWPVERRREWLICSDIEVPLSCDGMIWYSCLYMQSRDGVAHGFLQHLWTDARSMKKAWTESLEDASPGWIVGVTLCIDSVPDGYVLPWMDWVDSVLDEMPIYPNEIDGNWVFLGYDIADAWLLSGLTNCTHVRSPEFMELRNRFCPRVNRYHLFDSKDDAIEFRSAADVCFPDHAPFLIYRIWRVLQ